MALVCQAVRSVEDWTWNCWFAGACHWRETCWFWIVMDATEGGGEAPSVATSWPSSWMSVSLAVTRLR